MSHFDDFADNLHTEVVSEMAESYFGARKNIDDMTEVLEEWAEELRLWKPRLEKAANRLHTLLLDEKTVRDFYISLDIVPACIPFSGAGEPKELFSELPFAFTMRGKYIRCVRQAYRDFQRLVNEYLNGKYYDSADEKGRKRLTVHYIRFKAMVEYVNEEISKVNSKMTTGDTLRYLKRMDPEAEDKERILEACVGDSCALDKEMEYSPLEYTHFNLLEIQELPSLEVVKDDIDRFCREMWKRRKEKLKELIMVII